MSGKKKGLGRGLSALFGDEKPKNTDKPLQLKESQASTKTFLSQIFFKKSSPTSVQLLDVRKQNRKSTVDQKI